MASSVFAHNGVRLIAGGWTFFIAENLVLSENREYLVSKLGESGYRNCYGALSTIACSSIAIGYFRFGRNMGPVLWRPSGPIPQISAFALQSIGLIGFSQLAPPLQTPFALEEAAAPVVVPPEYQHPKIGLEAAETTKTAAAPLGLKARCPIDFNHARKVEGKEISGVKRVTRHPVLWSMAFLGLGSAVANPLATEVVFAVFPTIMAAIGGAHQDYRHRNSGLLTKELDETTSHFPFVAILSGKQSWNDFIDEFAWTNAGVAVSIAMLFAFRRQRALALFFKK